MFATHGSGIDIGGSSDQSEASCYKFSLHHKHRKGSDRWTGTLDRRPAAMHLDGMLPLLGFPAFPVYCARIGGWTCCGENPLLGLNRHHWFSKPCDNTTNMTIPDSSAVSHSRPKSMQWRVHHIRSCMESQAKQTGEQLLLC